MSLTINNYAYNYGYLIVIMDTAWIRCIAICAVHVINADVCVVHVQFLYMEME